VARAVAAQYANVTPVEHVYPLVRARSSSTACSMKSRKPPASCFFTLLEKDLVGRLEAKCQQNQHTEPSIIGPVMQLFQAYLGAATTGRVGAQHTLNAEYFKRIDALNYTMIHDDGQHVEGLEDADVVLVGVSRTSKNSDLDLISPTAASAPRTFRWCRALRSRSIGGAEKAAGGQSARDTGAAHSGSQNRLLSMGDSGQRHLYRSSGRRR